MGLGIWMAIKWALNLRFVGFNDLTFFLGNLIPLEKYKNVGFLFIRNLTRLEGLISCLLDKWINVASRPFSCMDQMLPLNPIAYLTRDKPNDPSLIHSPLLPLN